MPPFADIWRQFKSDYEGRYPLLPVDTDPGLRRIGQYHAAAVHSDTKPIEELVFEISRPSLFDSYPTLPSKWVEHHVHAFPRCIRCLNGWSEDPKVLGLLRSSEELDQNKAQEMLDIEISNRIWGCLKTGRYGFAIKES